MKHIIIFSTAYLPLAGGAEIAVKEITARLPDYEFDLVTARIDRSLPKKEKIGDVTVYRLGWGCRLDKFYLAFLGGEWAAKNISNSDAIWAIMASFGGLAALSFKKYHPEIPYLLTLQEGDDLAEVEKKARPLGKRFREIFARADYVQAISNYLADWARRMNATCPIEVIPNGVDLKKLVEKQPSVIPASCPSVVLSEEGQAGNYSNQLKAYNIITTSRLVKKNGIAD